MDFTFQTKHVEQKNLSSQVVKENDIINIHCRIDFIFCDYCHLKKLVFIESAAECEYVANFTCVCNMSSTITQFYLGIEILLDFTEILRDFILLKWHVHCNFSIFSVSYLH